MKLIKNKEIIKKIKIGDFCLVSSSKRIFANEYKNTGVPFFRGTEINNKEKNNQIFISEDRFNYLRENYGVPQYGDVLITAVGTIGNTYIVNKEMYYKDGNVLSLSNYKINIIPEYLKLMLDYNKNNIIIEAGGSAYGALKINTLKVFELTIHNYKDQSKITEILNKSKEKINNIKTLLEKINIRNQYYADKLLSGKLRLTRNILELKNNEDYEYDKIKISDICQISTGKKDANEGSEDGVYEFFTCSLENKKINSYSYDEEAILITGNGDPGVCKYFNGKFDAYQRVYILRNIQINPKYFYYVLKSYFKDSIQNSKVGGVIQYIRLNDISDFEFKYPKNDDINTILVFLDKLKDQKEKVEKLLKLEEQRFEWLSDKLLSGEYIIED